MSKNLKTMTVRVTYVALRVLEAEMKSRIFVSGTASDGSSIGQYSTNPITVTKEDFAKKSSFRPGGKRSNKKLNPRTSMYVPGGYKELRELQGLEAQFVNTDYSGSLKHSIRVVHEGTAFALVISRDDKADIAEELEKQFKKEIYSPTMPEMLIVDNTVERFLSIELKKYGFDFT